MHDLTEPTGYIDINGLHLLAAILAYTAIETLGASVMLVVLA